MTKKAGILSAYLEEKKSKKGVRFYIRYQDIDKKRYRVSGGEKKGRALALLSQFEMELNSKDALEARLKEGMTYSQYRAKVDTRLQLERLSKRPIKEFLAERLQASKYEKSPNTTKAYYRCHKQFLDYIDDYNTTNKLSIVLMEEITLPVLEGFQLYLSTKLGFSPASISQRVNIMRGILNRAEKLGIIKKSPSIQLDQVVIPEKEIITYSDDELTRLFNVIQSLNKIWYLYIKIALDTGARPMELQELVRKKHIFFHKEGNIEYGTILIESQTDRTTKTKNSRHVGITMETVQLLKPYLLSFNDDDVIFKNIDKSKGKKYASFLKLAGIPSFKSIYTLRRNCLSQLARKGLSPIQLMKVAGHKNIGTSLKYYISLDSKDIARDLALADYKIKSNLGEGHGNKVEEAKALYAS